MGREATKSKQQLIDDVTASILASPDHFGQFRMTAAQLELFLKVAQGLLATEAAIIVLLAAPHPAAKVVAIVLQALLVAYAIQASVEEANETAQAAAEWWTTINDTGEIKDPAAHAAGLTKAAAAFARLVYHLVQAIINAVGAVAGARDMRLSEGESSLGKKPKTGEKRSTKPLTSHPNIPQGLTPEQFSEAANRIRSKTGHINGEVVVQGSRAAWTAKPTSDIDFAIRVPSEHFDELVQTSFGSPNPGSAKMKTMQHAIKTGKIQAGEAGLRTLRQELEGALNMEVDISIIRVGGPFDTPPFISIPGGK